LIEQDIKHRVGVLIVLSRKRMRPRSANDGTSALGSVAALAGAWKRRGLSRHVLKAGARAKGVPPLKPLPSI